MGKRTGGTPLTPRPCPSSMFGVPTAAVLKGTLVLSQLAYASHEELEFGLVAKSPCGVTCRKKTNTELPMLRIAPPTKPTVLLVDDDAAFRSILTEVLEETGCRVIEADNGAGALNMLKNLTPDLVLVDLVMPV